MRRKNLQVQRSLSHLRKRSSRLHLPSRLVALDDREDHLEAIQKAFRAEGGDCHCVRFDPEAELSTAVFSGVRVLFIDLHLTAGTTTSDNKAHYANIAGILEKVISPTGGPFILVLWTEHPQTRDELRQYLDQNIDPEKPHARPITVLAIDKTTYIDIGTGQPKAGAPSLQDALKAAIDENPQLAALLRWEMEVVAAAAATLSSILELVPPDQRTTVGYSAALDTMMSRLAVAALGASNAQQNPRAAINSALTPILADRVLNQDDAVGSNAAWKSALSQIGQQNLGNYSEELSGKLHSMMHIARPPAETIPASDWGAVVEFPYQITDEQMLALFGQDLEQLKRDVFAVKSEGGVDQWASCAFRLVRIGAACDYAQSQSGPITLLLGVEGPPDAMSKNKKKGAEAEWRSPAFAAAEGGTRELRVNCRFPVVVPPSEVTGWKAAYRLREPLLMDLINHAARHNSRPGYIRAGK